MGLSKSNYHEIIMKEHKEKAPATGIEIRMKAIFEIVEFHHMDKWGFKLLRAVAKESGFRTETVIRAIEYGKRIPSYYGITPEAISDSTTLDLGMRF